MISGYGSLANACKLYYGNDGLTKMLGELITKTQELFSSWSEEDKSEWTVYYPSHVKAIANVMSALDGHPNDFLLDVEQVLFQLVIDYPKLPIQFQDLAIESFVNASKFIDQRDLLLKAPSL